jgi:hypothetical protein
MTRAPVIIRVDANPEQGYEQMTRCLVLAAALQRRRRQAFFLSSFNPGSLGFQIKRAGFEWMEASAPLGSAEDLAEVCYLASLKKGSSVYNCGADNFGTMKQSLEALCNYANTGSKVKSIPKNLTIIGMRLTSFFGLSPLGAYHSLMYGETMYFDNKKVKAELDWSPKYSNIDMLIESYDWYLNNRHKISEIENASPHRSRVKQKILNLLKFML